MLKFLNKPYPFNDDLRHNTKIIFLISLGLFVFFFLFEPFEIQSLDTKEKIQIVLGIVLATFISLSINLLLLPSILHKLLTSEKWTVKKEILWNSWILFTIMISYVAYYQIVEISIFDLSITTIFQILLMGLLPISILITINQERLLRTYKKTANELNKKIEEKKSIKNIIITIDSDYQKDSLTLKLISILNIRSAGNYIEVFWIEGNSVKKQMIRTSMNKAEVLFEKYEFIFKCHRSHLINTKNIEKIEGNYQGYRVFFKNMEDPIPVSRIYAKNLHDII